MQSDIRQAAEAHDYAWTVLEGILPFSAAVHKRDGQRSSASASSSNYDALDELMRQSERAMKELEDTLLPTQEQDNLKATTRRKIPGTQRSHSLGSASLPPRARRSLSLAPLPSPRVQQYRRADSAAAAPTRSGEDAGPRLV